jgi:hypothetical protein
VSPPAAGAACEQAAVSRARVPGLLAEGKLDRVVRVVEESDRVCPETAPTTWPALLETLLELGRWEEAESLAAEIGRRAAATPTWPGSPGRGRVRRRS